MGQTSVVTKRSPDRLGPGHCQISNLFTHNVSLFTKQYNLVPVQEQ